MNGAEASTLPGDGATVPPKTILSPVDLSTRSERGLAYAAMLARAFDAELVVFLNVNANGPEHEAVQELAIAEGLSHLEAGEVALRRLIHRCAPDVRSTVHVRFDDHPGEGILDAAERTNADAIVMASHGHSGMRRWWLGSTAETTMRGAYIPVIVLPIHDA